MSQCSRAPVLPLLRCCMRPCTHAPILPCANAPVVADKGETIKGMEDFEMRHRRRLRHDYTVTSNVLLFGYEGLSDGAKVTYQVIDSFDWTDADGLRKGYAYPSKQTLANVRGVGEKTIQRHFAELEHVGLLTREARAGRPSLLIIEDPSEDEEEKYLARFGRGGVDKNVQGREDKNVHPNNKHSKPKTNKLVNEEKPLRNERGVPESLKEILSRHASDIRRGKPMLGNEQRARREYLASEMLAVLGDVHSLGFYRRVAGTQPPELIFSILGVVKELARAGSVQRNKGALFTHLLKDTAEPRISKALQSPTVNANICSDEGSGGPHGDTREPA